jgi:hypothetical protein
VTFGSDLGFDRYPVDNKDEWMMRIGAADAPPILLIAPLFEELNRTRALIAALMRNLAAQGYGCWLPDLPGTGESERPLEEVSWALWRDAARSAGAFVSASGGRSPVVASLRGGCLIDEAVPAPRYWRFAPAEGASLARDLFRSSLVAATEQKQDVSDLAGYPVPTHLLDDLGKSFPHPLENVRYVRLESDRADADLKVAGPALWRRSEPGTSPPLAEALANDLPSWCERCGAF